MSHPKRQMYLEDIYPGQRFTTRTHAIDEKQIKAFAQQFDPRLFISTTRPLKGVTSDKWLSG
jgi:hypothetical protein